MLKFYHDSEALGSKLQIFQDYVVSQFPKETWAQRKPNQIIIEKLEKWPESLGVVLEF